VVAEKDTLDVTFDFDTEVLGSDVYRNYFASLIKRNAHRRLPEVPGPLTDFMTVHDKGRSEKAVERPILHSDSRPLIVTQWQGETSSTSTEDGKITNDRILNLYSPRKMEALYDYVATNPKELNIKRGDIIQVMLQFDNGWWDGVLHGKRGWFPSNYCQVFDGDDAGLADDASLNGRMLASIDEYHKATNEIKNRLTLQDGDSAERD